VFDQLFYGIKLFSVDLELGIGGEQQKQADKCSCCLLAGVSCAHGFTTVDAMNTNVHVCLGIYWPSCGRSILVVTNSDFSV
jgi:hypothetical protein